MQNWPRTEARKNFESADRAYEEARREFMRASEEYLRAREHAKAAKAEREEALELVVAEVQERRAAADSQ